MQRLERISPYRHSAGGALPDLLGLAKHGVLFHRGQVTIIAGQPSVGKSILALGGLAIPWAKQGVKSLYFSADSDEYTTLKRATAALTGESQSRVVQQMTDGGDWNKVQHSLAGLAGRVSFSFETDPTYQHLYAETIAFYHAWGEYPDVIFFDNLMDFASENENEYGAMRDSSKAAKRLARQTGAQVVLLHHCNESEGYDLKHPPSRAMITGKVSQKAELVFTLGLDDKNGIMRIAPVKNRDGRQDRSGRYNIQLRVDFERAKFTTMDDER